MSVVVEQMFGTIDRTMTAQMDDEISVLAGHFHATTAHFVDKVTAFDESQEWAGVGLRSCAHWLTIATGVDLYNAHEMLRVGHALRFLPLIHAAFAAGRLSFDKVRAITHVATAEDEALWLELAVQASGAQLARICRAYRYAIAVDDPERAARQRARRRVVSWWLDEDGMLALYATLPPEEGRLVLNAIEAAVAPRVPCGAPVGHSPTGDSPAGDPCAEREPDHPLGARRADALVRICERWLADVAAGTPAGTARPELVVHVDADTLRSPDAGGRCHIEDGPAIAVEAARRLGCDASVVTVLERDGVPVDVGRGRRLVTGRLRRALHLRDQGCRYPGCPVLAADTEGHHVIHWIDGGRTDLSNLVSLCRFHHHRHHDGAFRIIANGDGPHPERGGFRFETADGRAIAVRETHGIAEQAMWLPDTTAITPKTAVAVGGGERFDVDHTIVVTAGNIAIAAARRREQNQPP